MLLTNLKNSNVHEIDIKEIPENKLIGKLLLEQTIKYPGDLVVIDGKSYITVEKINHYYFDGLKYQFAKTSLIVRSLERFC